MSLTFTAQNRLDITRRQLNITTENAGYATASAQLTTQQTMLLNVDTANAVFYTAAEQSVNVYESEALALTGVMAATYTDGTINPFTAGDMSSSAQTPGASSATFFPQGYAEYVPKEIPAVNGINHPTGIAASYEGTTLTSLSANIIFLLNGITGAVNTNTTTTASLPGGAQTAFSLSVTSGTGFTTNDYVFISDGTNSGIYQITAAASLSITINSILPSTSSIATHATVFNTVIGFTNSQRQSLSGGTYQEILTNLSTLITSLITIWSTFVQSQITQLTANTETRSPYASQNATALSDDNAALSVITAWLALSPTGVNGQFVDTNIGVSSPLYTQIATRQSFATSRISQIIAALGSVTVTGNTFTGDTTSPYYIRYEWLNNRINTASGSARRFFATMQGTSLLNTLSTNNTMIQDNYNAYFTTVAITANDSTPIIEVTAVTGFSAGDKVTVVSETQPEITRGIVSIMGTTQFELDAGIPNSYITKDIARIFKTLQ